MLILISILALRMPDWQYYQEGVLSPSNCDYQANHGVVLVGYGKGIKYIFILVLAVACAFVRVEFYYLSFILDINKISL